MATVLGLVGRDLLLDTLQAVADEDAPASFALAARAVEMGYDLRAVCRELSRVVRDLLVLSVDPSRISDPEIAGEGERDRLKALAGRFSREDLLRAFDLLTRAEQEIRSAAQPRYHLEMALLRWIHLRKLVSIEDLIAGAGGGSAARPAPRSAAPRAAPAPHRRTPRAAPGSVARASHLARRRRRSRRRRRRRAAAARRGRQPSRRRPAPPSGDFKDALLAEIKKAKAVFYNMVVAQAQKIEVAGDRVTFTLLAGAARAEGPVRAAEGVARVDRAGRSPAAGSRWRRRRPTPGAAGAGAAAAGGREGGRRAVGREEVGAPRAGARRRRRADDARGLSRGDPRRRGNVNIQEMMKQAQQMQERLQKEMAELRVEGNAGGGMVTVVVNGAKQVQSITIDPEVVSKDDVEMLQDLIVAAINDAQRKADEEMAAEDGRHAAAGHETLRLS